MPESIQWARVRELIEDATPHDCIEWPYSRLPTGYGRWHLNENGRRVSYYAHREALKMVAGPAPTPQHRMALHSCANPPCINPHHLRWGTAQDNADDRARHGRFHVAVDDVNGDMIRWWARQRRVTQRNIALMFGVSTSTVQRVEMKR